MFYVGTLIGVGRDIQRPHLAIMSFEGADAGLLLDVPQLQETVAIGRHNDQPETQPIDAQHGSLMTL